MADTHEYDVVCIGGGIAGLVTAARAAELGLKVAVLERGAEDAYPCNSRYSGGVMHISYKDPANPKEALVRAINEITDGYAAPELVDAITGHCKRGLEWLQQQGARFMRIDPGMQRSDIGSRAWILAPVRPPVTQLEWKGRGADVTLRALEAGLLKRGGKMFRGTEATALVMDNGRCTGVAASQAGTPVTFKAGAVVMSDGGFQGNPDIVRQHIAPAPDKVKQRGAGTGRGDGLRMAREVGAEITPLDGFYGHILSLDAMQNDRLWPYPQLDLVAAAGLLVNRAGCRIADEGLGGVYMANIMARQADPQACFAIFDEVIWQDSGRAAAVAPNPNLEKHGGALFKADSIAGLARALGVDVAGLEKTVADYNAALAAGTLGQLTPARSTKRRKAEAIAKAPFYGAPASTGITYTMGGIRTDASARVLRPDRTPIAGLYAAGATTGGLEGGPCVGYVGGLMKGIVFGLLAAESIAGRQ